MSEHEYTGKRVTNEHGMIGTILLVRNGIAHVEYPQWWPDDASSYAVLVIGVDDLQPFPALPD